MTEYKDLEPSTNPKHKNEFVKNIIIAVLAVSLLLAIGYIVYSKEANAKSSIEMQSDINDLERSETRITYN